MFFCLVGYLCVNGSLTGFSLADSSCVTLRHPLCLLVDFCSKYFVMMLNKSTRVLNAALWVSFNVLNCAVDAGFCNASIKSHDESLASQQMRLLEF